MTVNEIYNILVVYANLGNRSNKYYHATNITETNQDNTKGNIQMLSRCEDLPRTHTTSFQSACLAG